MLRVPCICWYFFAKDASNINHYCWMLIFSPLSRESWNNENQKLKLISFLVLNIGEGERLFSNLIKQLFFPHGHRKNLKCPLSTILLLPANDEDFPYLVPIKFLTFEIKILIKIIYYVFVCSIHKYFFADYNYPSAFQISGIYTYSVKNVWFTDPIEIHLNNVNDSHLNFWKFNFMFPVFIGSL